MNYKKLNGVRTFAPHSRQDLISYAFKNKSILVAINAEKILYATDTSRDIINRNLGYPDGVGAVWALKKKGCTNVVKVPGCELWLNIITEYYKKETFYLVGGKEEVIQETVVKLQKEFQGINIINFRNGYVKTDTEKQDLIRDIVEKKPSIIFVAMGSPKQELLMEEMQKKHSALYQGLGGSFDLYTGKVKRAPDWWMKYFKWEGLYRSLSDFTNYKRWKRQKAAFVFIWKVWTKKL